MKISRRGLGLSAAAVAVAAVAAGTFKACTGGDDAEDGEKGLALVIGSSGEEEADAVRDAVAAFTKETGVEVRVLPASDLGQELSQSLASENPPDVFYLDAAHLATHARAGSLHAYGDQLPHSKDFYPSLVSNATHKGQVYGAPRGLSTLALFINTSLWEAAGLTEADYPTSWESLEAVSSRLAEGEKAALVLTPDHATANAFMAQAGGGLISVEEGSEEQEVTAGSEASVAGLAEMKKLLESHGAVLSSALDEGSGGDVFAAGQAVMTVAGYDLAVTLDTVFPDLGYAVVELPEGSAGRATVQQAGFYGIAEGSAHKKDALRLVDYLTSAEVQRTLAPAQGLVPAVSSAAEQWVGDNPGMGAFTAGADYAVYAPAGDGVTEVLTGFEEQLAGLPQADPAAVLGSLQVNLQVAVE